MKLNEVAFDYDAVESESLLYQIVKDLLQSGKGLYADAGFPDMYNGTSTTIKGRVIALSPTGSHKHWEIRIERSGDLTMRKFYFELSAFDDEFTIEQRDGKPTLVNV